MAQEWRIVHRTKGSTLKQLWLRLRSGLWAPTERFICDAQMMPIMGGSPGTVDKQVAASGDDAYRCTGAAGFNTLAQSSLVGYYSSSTWWHCHAFFRWIGVTAEGTIGANSYIECYAHADGSAAPELKVYVVDEADPPAPTTAGEFDADPLTDAATDWDGAWTINTWAQSPSLAAPLQEYVDTFGPIVNKALMMQLKNDKGASQAYNTTRHWNYTGNLHGPKLHIEYTAGGAVYYHGLKVQGEGELALCDVGNHPLRIRKGGMTYGIELVAIDDPNATRIRIKTPTGIKAVKKYT